MLCLKEFSYFCNSKAYLLGRDTQVWHKCNRNYAGNILAWYIKKGAVKPLSMVLCHYAGK